MRQKIQDKSATKAKADIEASSPAKGNQTSFPGSPTNLDPAKRTKTGPPHHVFDFRFARPAKSRPTTFDHLSKPSVLFCAAKINFHGEDIVACLFLPYARVRHGSHNLLRPGPGAHPSERIGPLAQKQNENQLDTGHCPYWHGFGSFLSHYIAS